ncbi:LptF/LptG family permease [Pseudooceanicola sp. LIPI14-2-Ac024]|uniref:LptF/LptG family permease n=1 Tax=Pseudooceanicola sp. LIPI14-2-Ac024 TaxID=3344875 RepID=UPI0035D049C4
MALRSFTGRAMRLALREHLTAFVSVQLVLIFIALMIDFADSFDSIRAAAEGQSLAWVLGQYTVYRAADIVARLMPVAALLGAFIAEIRRRALLETVILASAGVSALPTFAALLWIGACTGFLQWKLERDWRPAAVFAQVALGAGSYAERYGPGLTDDQQWFIQDDAAIAGRVLVGPQPELRDVSYFLGLNGQGFDRVVRADTVRPVGGGQWVFENAEIWTATEGGRLIGVPEAELELPLWFAPNELTYLNPTPFYLPQPVLNARARLDPDDPFVRTTQWRRWTAWVLPGLFAMLGATLAMTGFRGRVTRVPILVAMAFGGYLSTLSLKVFWALGEQGALAAPVAVLLPIVLALAMILVLQWLLNKEARGRRLPLG